MAEHYIVVVLGIEWGENVVILLKLERESENVMAGLRYLIFFSFFFFSLC